MFSSIRSRIVALCVAIVVAALAVNAAINYVVADSYNDTAIDSSLTALQAGHAGAIADWVDGHGRMIASLRAAVLQADPSAALKQVADAGGFVNVYVGYDDKRAMFSNPTGIPAGYDPTGRPWYRQAAAAGKPVVTPPYVDAGSGKLVVAFAAPVVADGGVKAVVSGDVAMDRVIANVKAIQPTPSSFGMLVTQAGLIVAHPDDKLTLKPVADLVPGLDAAQLAALLSAAAPTEVQVGGAARLLRARAIPNTDWIVVIALDKAEATAGMRSVLMASALTLIAIALVAAALAALATGASFRRLSQVRDVMDAIGSADGDLTRRLPADGKDEVAQIARAFNTFVDKLCTVMRQIRDASESVRHAADEIAAGNLDLSQRTESAAASLQQTAASMEQITATVAQSAMSARQADDSAVAASRIACEGGVVIGEVIGTMDKIEHASTKVSDIIGVIEGIAFQTNILALNAAVEAARAGDQGRGFAVVAGEVRGLAQRSAQAAKEIRTLIESTVGEVAACSGQVRQAGETMTAIVGNVSQVSTVISEISNAAVEQTRGIQEVNQAVGQLDEMVQQNAALVEQSSAAASALQAQANKLAGAVGLFRLA
ncbi:methyl-accepting chemotaxis protein [Cupriavidus gilardii]|uniref:methyl-accepting chemotaxis protein n=1 Tax=Cupriavidus gilardii TaxID=82541 RepID=UPI001573C641|nr:methyl-accepting chemotaxis protein [Cupriavidus gilardii]NSX04382.1 HAMP domain-containing protein [Cupriavidus gilardii]